MPYRYLFYRNACPGTFSPRMSVHLSLLATERRDTRVRTQEKEKKKKGGKKEKKEKEAPPHALTLAPIVRQIPNLRRARSVPAVTDRPVRQGGPRGEQTFAPPMGREGTGGFRGPSSDFHGRFQISHLPVRPYEMRFRNDYIILCRDLNYQ